MEVAVDLLFIVFLVEHRKKQLYIVIFNNVSVKSLSLPLRNVVKLLNNKLPYALLKKA